jgi:hypothetical protein
MGSQSSSQVSAHVPNRYPHRDNSNRDNVRPMMQGKPHKHEAVSVSLALEQYKGNWENVPIEVVCLMHKEHEFKCCEEELRYVTDPEALEAECYDNMKLDEYLQAEMDDRNRSIQVFNMTAEVNKESWQQCKWCWVCGLDNHTYVICPFRDFRTEYNLSSHKLKFQPDVMIDLIMTACKHQGYLSKESGNTAITLRETVMRERAEYMNMKKKALSDGSFKHKTSNGPWNNHYQQQPSNYQQQPMNYQQTQSQTA